MIMNDMDEYYDFVGTCHAVMSDNVICLVRVPHGSGVDFIYLLVHLSTYLFIFFFPALLRLDSTCARSGAPGWLLLV